MHCSRPHVGIGILILNEKDQILIGKRKGSHAPFYSIPGGSLETGETFEEAAIREAAEETGLRIYNPRVINLTNNLETYRAFGMHFISVTLLVKSFEGTPLVLEPEKCESWDWYDPKQLPEPHFDASRMGVALYLKGAVYEDSFSQ